MSDILKDSGKKISLSLDSKPKFISWAAAKMESGLGSKKLGRLIRRENKERKANGRPLIALQGDLYNRADLFAAIENQKKPAAKIEQDAIERGLIRLNKRAKECGLEPPTLVARCKRHGIKIELLRTRPPPIRFEPGYQLYERWIDDKKSLPIAQREVRKPSSGVHIDADGLRWLPIRLMIELAKKEKAATERKTLENWADGTILPPGGFALARKPIDGTWHYLESGKVEEDGKTKVGLLEIAAAKRDRPPLPPHKDKAGGTWYPLGTAMKRSGWGRQNFDDWRSGKREAPGVGRFIINEHGRVDQWRGRDVWFFHESVLVAIKDALDYVEAAKEHPVRYPAKKGKVYLHSKICNKLLGGNESTLHMWDSGKNPLPDGLQLKRHPLSGLDGLYCLKSEVLPARKALLKRIGHGRVPHGLKKNINLRALLKPVIDHRELPGLSAPKRGKRGAGNAQPARTPPRGRNPRRYEKPVLMALKEIYPALLDQAALGKKCQPRLSDKTVRECLKVLRTDGLTKQPYGKNDQITPAGLAYLEKLTN